MNLSARPVSSGLFPIEPSASETTTDTTTTTTTVIYPHSHTHASSSVFQSTTGSPCSSPSAPLSSSGLSSPGTVTPLVKPGAQEQPEPIVLSVRPSSSSSSSSPSPSSPPPPPPPPPSALAVHPERATTTAMTTTTTTATAAATMTDHLSALDVLLSAAEELSSASGSSADGSSPPSALAGSTARHQPLPPPPPPPPSTLAIPSTASALGGRTPGSHPPTAHGSPSMGNQSMTASATASTPTPTPVSGPELTILIKKSSPVGSRSRANPTEGGPGGASVGDSVPMGLPDESAEPEELTTKGKKRKVCLASIVWTVWVSYAFLPSVCPSVRRGMSCERARSLTNISGIPSVWPLSLSPSSVLASGQSLQVRWSVHPSIGQMPCPTLIHPFLLPSFLPSFLCFVRVFVRDRVLPFVRPSDLSYPIVSHPIPSTDPSLSSACHKNKRRCSGELPCSNCEFSGRECIYLSSSGQPVPAPRANRPRSGSAVSVSSSNGRRSPDLSVPASVSFSSTSVSVSTSSKQNSAKRAKVVLTTAPVETTPGSIPLLIKPSPLSMGTSLLGEGFYSRPVAGEAGFAAGANGAKNVPSSGKALLHAGRTPSNGSATANNGNKKQQPTKAVPSGRATLIPIHSSPQPSVLAVLPALLRRSLIQTFFQTFGEPICSIFHRPSFDHASYNDTLHPVLTLAIFAFAARFSSHPFFRSRQAGGTGTEPRERSTRGDVFAKEVDIFFNTNDPSAWDAEGREEELAQGLALMVVYESLMSRGKSMVFYMDILIPYITKLTNSDRVPSDHASSNLSRRAITKRETRSRIFWFSYSLSCFLDAQVWTVRPAGRFTEEACSLALPIDDASFDLGIEPSSPKGRLRGGDPEGTSVSELGYLARVAEIFQKTVSTPLSPASSSSIQDQEASLAAWAQSLPPGLQFNKVNLEAAGRKIRDGAWAVEEDAQGDNGGATGHLFAGIHMAAEVAMFFHLQAVKKSSSGIDTPKEEHLSRRQAQAIENIVFLLEAVGEKGRRNPSCFFPLYIASKWRSQILASDERLAALWKENYQVWGFDSGFAFISTSRKAQSDIASSTVAVVSAGPGLGPSSTRGVKSLNGFSSRVPPFLSSSSSSSSSSSAAAAAKLSPPTAAATTTTTTNSSGGSGSSLGGNSHAPRRATFSAGDYPRLPSIQSFTSSSSSLTISPNPSSGLPSMTIGSGRTPDPFLISPRTFQGLFPAPTVRRPSISSPALTK